MAMVDRDGRLLRYGIYPGNAAESPLPPELIDGVRTDELIADKAYDSDTIRNLLADEGGVATIPPRRNRHRQYPDDAEPDCTRHLVENPYADLKQFRGLATRYCKLAPR